MAGLLTVESKHKMEIMRKILPSLPLTYLPNLVDSELWAAAVTRATVESQARKGLGQRKKRRVPLTFAQPASGLSAKPWAGAPGGDDGNYIDDEEFKSRALPLPSLSPSPSAHTDPTVPNRAVWEDPNQSTDMTPTRIVVEGYSFWKKKPHGTGVQEWVFQRLMESATGCVWC